MGRIDDRAGGYIKSDGLRAQDAKPRRQYGGAKPEHGDLPYFIA